MFFGQHSEEHKHAINHKILMELPFGDVRNVPNGFTCAIRLQQRVRVMTQFVMQNYGNLQNLLTNMATFKRAYI